MKKCVKEELLEIDKIKEELKSCSDNKQVLELQKRLIEKLLNIVKSQN